MILDESGDLKSLEIRDNDDINELLKIQDNEANLTKNEGDIDFDDGDTSPFEKVKEDYQPTMGHGSSYQANQEETHLLESDDS